MIRHIICRLFKIIIFVICIGLLVYVYGRYIEPERLVIKEERLYTSNLRVDKPLRIIQCSDLHLGEDYDMAHLERIVNQINALDPDIFLFTGDLIDDNRKFKDEDRTIELLRLIDAPYGKYGIMGNHDYGWKGPKLYLRIMELSGIKLLINESVSIDIDKENKLNIIGIDDVIFGQPDIETAMKNIDAKDYNILMCHEPDVADEFQGYPIDLQLSGHSHGGQINLPLIGAPFATPYGRKYVKGMYQMPENERMKLFVNIGIGTSQVHYRLGCVPELVVFEIS